MKKQLPVIAIVCLFLALCILFFPQETGTGKSETEKGVTYFSDLPEEVLPAFREKNTTTENNTVWHKKENGDIISYHPGTDAPHLRYAPDGYKTEYDRSGRIIFHDTEAHIPIYSKGGAVSWYGGVHSEKLSEGRYLFFFTDKENPSRVLQVLIDRIDRRHAYAFFPDESREVLYNKRKNEVVWESVNNKETKTNLFISLYILFIKTRGIIPQTDDLQRRIESVRNSVYQRVTQSLQLPDLDSNQD